MINLNCGNLWTNTFLDKVIELNAQHSGDDIQVKSMFGSLAYVTPTARSFDRIPSRDWDFAERYIMKAQNAGIAIRYTLNQSCLGSLQSFYHDWVDRLRNNITLLHAIGVHEWTITSPLLIELLKKDFGDDLLEVSTIAELSTPHDATQWMKVGATGVNVSTSINRNFNRIRAICQTGIRVSLLANEACLYRCPWRRDCYNSSSHDSRREELLFHHYPFSRCQDVRMKSPIEWLHSRLILPQWMEIYQKKTGVDWFKLAFRTAKEPNAIDILSLYMNKHHGGNICDLWPTIAHLGNTGEPAEQTNIPCSKLDNEGFLNSWYLNDVCDETTCVECGYCDMVYRRVASTQ